jgi:hypothetical protein
VKTIQPHQRSQWAEIAKTALLSVTIIPTILVGLEISARVMVAIDWAAGV